MNEKEISLSKEQKEIVMKYLYANDWIEIFEGDIFLKKYELNKDKNIYLYVYYELGSPNVIRVLKPSKLGFELNVLLKHIESLKLELGKINALIGNKGYTGDVILC